MKKKLGSVLISFCLLASLVLPVLPAQAVSSDDIVILYTNDTHSSISDTESLNFDNVAALKKEMLTQTDHVLLVDAGDHLQGTAYGAMDEGQNIIQLMNAAGYDLATFGNHEFDYTLSGTQAAIAAASFPYLSCNFKPLKPGGINPDSYKMFDFNGTKVAVIGITTPDTFASTAPSYFQDEGGNYLYEIAIGGNGQELYAKVQEAIDAATADGADYLIGLGHLGVDLSASPWTSREVIANTKGLDALIDGHSHTQIEKELIKDKAGEDVLLTQTGSHFANIGKLCIEADGDIDTELISEYDKSDATVRNRIDQWVSEVSTQLGEKIANSEVSLTLNGSTQKRMVRTRGTNLGDFNTDAFYYLLNEVEQLDCDVAVMNGGGIRANAETGDWSYLTLKSINPYGNVLCMLEMSGQQLLDALEWGARFTTGQEDSPESGAFLHTAGVCYSVDTSIPSTVQEKDGIWTGGPTGAYRVHSVKIYDKASGTYKPLDLKGKYNIVGANFTLRNLGDGFDMFKGAVLIKDYIMEDYMALAAYAKAFKDSDSDGYAEINSKNSPLSAYKGYLLNYENPDGSGRIKFEASVTAADPENTFVSPATGDNFTPIFFIGSTFLLLCMTSGKLVYRRKAKS